MDREEADAEPRRPLRLPERVGSSAVGRRGCLRPGEKLSGSEKPAQLQGPEPTARCCLRSLRQRQDRREGDDGTVRDADRRQSRPALAPGEPAGEQREPDMGRCQWQLHPRLRPGAARRERRMRSVVEHEVRTAHQRDAARRRRLHRLRPPRVQLAGFRLAAARAASRAFRERGLLPHVVRELHGDRQPRHWSGRLLELLHHVAVQRGAAGRRREPDLRPL